MTPKAQDEEELVGQLRRVAEPAPDAALAVAWKGRLVVRDAAEASRLHNKGWYGRPQSGGALELDPLEAALLVETGRLRVVESPDGVPRRPLDLESLLRDGVAASPDFAVRYFAYRDLRLRGYLVKAAKRSALEFLAYPRGATPHTHQPSTLVGARGERDPLRLRDLLAWAAEAGEERLACWLGLVDEEGDVTYYELALVEPEGVVAPRAGLPRAAGALLEDRVLVWDAERAAAWLAAEWIGRPVAGGLQLSLVESAHLLDRGVLEVRGARDDGAKPVAARTFRRLAAKAQPDLGLRLAAYGDLKRRGLVVKTGFKFGAHFRAYDRSPGASHARFLVHALPPEHETTWPELARAVRLAHSVRKELLLAVVEASRVRYLRLARLRP